MSIFLINDTSVEEHFGCAKVISNLDDVFSDLGISVIGRSYVGESFESIMEKKEIFEARLVVINGEGTLHSSNPYRAVIENVVREVKKKNGKIILINASVYLTYNEVEFLRDVDFVTVRSRASAKLLDSFSIDSVYIPDMSLMDKSLPVGNEGHGALYTDSVIPAVTSKIFRLFRIDNSSGRYLSYLQPALQKSGLLKYPRFSFRILGRKISFRSFIDVLPSTLHSIFVSPREINIDEWISGCDKVITGRFHAVCMAVKHQKMVEYYESNTSKITDFLVDVEVASLFSKSRGGRCFIEGKREREAYYARVAQFVSDLPGYRQQLLGYIKGVHDECLCD